MNREEYYASKFETWQHRYVLELIRDWKIKNNITEQCVIHHRDDTEECVEYNEKHYERWGFDDSGEFEYGKYVVFMTRRDHTTYHNASRKNTNETKSKMSKSAKASWNDERRNYYYTNVLTDEYRMKLSVAAKSAWTDERKLEYSKNWSGSNSPIFGKKASTETIEHLKESHITYYKNNPNAAAGENNGFYGKTHTDDAKNRIRAAHKIIIKGKKLLYKVYKENGGIFQWNDFQKELSSGGITFEYVKPSIFLEVQNE